VRLARYRRIAGSHRPLQKRKTKNQRSAPAGQIAQVAIAHKMLTDAYNMLLNGAFYSDPGPDYYTRHHPGKTKAKAVKQLEALGYHVTLEPLTDAAQHEYATAHHLGVTDSSREDAGVENPQTPSDSAHRAPGEAAVAALDEVPSSVRQKAADAKDLAVQGAQILTSQARARPVLPVALIAVAAVGVVVWRRRH
jgi:hypothetical protein